MNGAVDETKKLARPHRIGGADGLRLADRGSDHPIPRPQMRSKPAGNAEADQTAIALPDGRVSDLFELLAGRAADHLHSWGSGDARLEVQSDKCNDEASMRFNGRCFGDPRRVIRISHQSIDESSPRKIQLGCH